MTDVLYEEFWNACKEGNVKVVKQLLSNLNIDPSTPNKNHHDFRALDYATESGHVSVVNILLEDNRVDPCADDNSAIINACDEGHEHVMRVLLKNSKIDPKPLSKALLESAISNGHVPVLDLLLEDPRISPIEIDPKTILTAAEENRFLVLQRLAQDQRIVFPQNAISTVASDGNTDVVRYLLAHAQHEHPFPCVLRYVLVEAAGAGQEEVVRMILAYQEAEPEFKALSVAVENGHVEVVRILLLDPRSEPGANDNSLILRAREKKHVEIESLLANDPRVDASVLRMGEIIWERYFLNGNLLDIVKSILPSRGKKKRKFVETIEIQIPLQNYSPEKDKRINFSFLLPYESFKNLRIILFANPEECAGAKEAGIECLTTEDIKKFNKDKKLIKKRFKPVNIALFASTSVIRQIPRLMGPTLAKLGKFPNLWNPSLSFESLFSQEKRRTKFYLPRKQTAICAKVGTLKLTPDQVVENIKCCVEQLSTLNWPLGWKMVKNIIIKTTMGKPHLIYHSV